MPTYIYRANTAFGQNTNGTFVAAGGSVVVYTEGGVASVDNGNSTTVTLYPGHAFTTGDFIMVNLDITSYRGPVTVSGDVLTTATPIDVNVGDIIVNLGDTETGGVAPAFDGSNATVYSEPDASFDIADATVNINATGEYGYYHTGDVDLWELVLDSLGAPQDIVRDIYTNATALNGPSNGVSTDNAVVLWDGTDGRTVKNSVVIANAGAVSGITTLTTTGATTLGGALAITGALTGVTTLTTSGLITGGAGLDITGTSDLETVTATTVTATGNVSSSAGSLSSNTSTSVGTTLSVGGATTLTGGIAGGVPYNIGTWNITAVTNGNDTAPTASTIYYGSIFVPMNCTITGIQYLIGTASGNSVVVSIYNLTGVLKANSNTAGTAVSTLATIQQVPFTATYSAVGPAYYYIGLNFNGTTLRFRTIPVNMNIHGIVGGSQTQTFATPINLVSPATTFTENVVPVAGVY